MNATFEFLNNSPKLNEGKLIVAFPSIYMFDAFYSHGKVLGQVVSLSHKMKPFLRIWIPDFYPEIPLQTAAPDQIDYVQIDNKGIASLPYFEQTINTKRYPHFTDNCYAEFLMADDEYDDNFILLTKPKGYSPSLFMRNYSELYLKIAKEIGVSEIYSVGSRLAEVSPRGKLMGYSTSIAGSNRLEKNGIALMRDEIAPYFTNVILGVASERFGMRGYRINSNHGEEPPYENSTRQMLDMLYRISGISCGNDDFDKVMDEWFSSLKLTGAFNLSNQR